MTKLLNRLENYYGGSPTFFGQNNSILLKIMQYKFNNCLGCDKFVDAQIVCQNCIKTKMIKVDTQILVICSICNSYHHSTFKIECQVCKEDVTNIFNVNGIDICNICLNIPDDSDTESDSDD